MNEIAGHFINVDLDIKSGKPLNALAEAWSDRVSPLHLDRLGRKHWLALELIPQPPDPESGILGFCRMVRRLRGAARAAWQNASAREFDIGIQAGLEHRSAEWVLSRRVMEALHDVGGHVRVTVYSPLALIEEEQRRRRRIVPADTATRRKR
jgi:hypothetical protein